MANRLKMTVVQSILSLYAQRWSRRRIATALGIDRGTVGRHVRQALVTTACGGCSNASARFGLCRCGGWSVSRGKRPRWISALAADQNARRQAAEDARAPRGALAFAQRL